MRNKQTLEAWLNRLLRMGKIEEDDNHRELGKYYGYAKCCVESFVQLNKEVKAPALVADIIYGIDDPNIGYVRCPKCRKGAKK